MGKVFYILILVFSYSSISVKAQHIDTDPLKTKGMFVDSIFNRYWNGDITLPSETIDRAIRLCDDLIGSELDVLVLNDTKVKKVILESFKLYVQSYYEMSLNISIYDSRQLLYHQISRLDEAEHLTNTKKLIAALNLSKAYSYDRLKLYDKFLTFSEKALLDAPNWAYALSAIGDAWSYTGDYEKSEEYLVRSINLAPELLNNYYILGWSMSALGRNEEGLQMAYKSLSINPNFFLAYNLLSKIYSDLNDSKKDIESLKKLLQINPKWLRGYTNLAYSYRSIGDYKMAKYYTKKAIEINPYWPVAYEDLGDSYSYTSKKDSALYYYNKGIEADSLYAPSYLSIGDIFAFRRDTGNAIKYFLQATRVDSFYDWGFSRVGDIYFQEKKYKLAIPYLQRAADLNPKNNALIHLCESYNAIGNYRKAIPFWEKVIQNNSANKQYIVLSEKAFSGLSDELLSKDSVGEAIKCLDRGAKLGSHYSRYAVLGLKYEYGIETKQDFDLALFYYKKRSERFNARDYYLDAIIRLYEQSKVTMDLNDYNLWVNVKSKGLKKFTIPCINHEGRRMPFDLQIQYDYPPNVHPIAWEAERLNEEYGAIVPIEVMESFQKLLQLARKNEVSFPELCEYALEAANEENSKERKAKIENRIENLKFRIEQADNIANKISAYNQLIDFYKTNYSAEEPVFDLKRASKDYLNFAKIQFTENKYSNAESLAENAYLYDTLNGAALRYMVFINVVAGDYKTADSLCVKYQNRDYPSGDQTWTYGDYFLEDIEFYESKHGTTLAIQTFKLRCLSVAVKLRKGLITEEQIIKSNDKQTALEGFKYFWHLYQSNGENMTDLLKAIDLLEFVLYKLNEKSIRPELLKLKLVLWRKDNLLEKQKFKIEHLYDEILQNKDPLECKEAADDFWNFWEQDDPVEVKLYAQDHVVNLSRVAYLIDPQNKKKANDFSRKVDIFATFLNEDKQFKKAGIACIEGLKADSTNIRLHLEISMSKLVMGKFDDAQKIWRSKSNISFPNTKYAKTFGEALLKEIDKYVKKGLLVAIDAKKVQDDLKNYMNQNNILIQHEFLDLENYYSKLSTDEQTDNVKQVVDLMTNQTKFNKITPLLIRLSHQLIKLNNAHGTLLVARAIKSKYNDSRLPENIRIGCSKIAIDIYLNIYTAFSNEKEILDAIADDCGGYSFAILKFNEFEYGLKAAELAYNANPTDKFARSNLPLAYLLNDKFVEAKTYYLKFTNLHFGDGKLYKDVFLSDISEMKNEGIVHPDFNKIVELLNN